MEAGPYDPANCQRSKPPLLLSCYAAMAAGPYDPANLGAAVHGLLQSRNGGGALRPRKPRRPGRRPRVVGGRNGGGALRPRKLHDGMFTRAILNEPQWRRGLTTPQTRVTTG